MLRFIAKISKIRPKIIKPLLFIFGGLEFLRFKQLKFCLKNSCTCFWLHFTEMNLNFTVLISKSLPFVWLYSVLNYNWVYQTVIR